MLIVFILGKSEFRQQKPSPETKHLTMLPLNPQKCPLHSLLGSPSCPGPASRVAGLFPAVWRGLQCPPSPRPHALCTATRQLFAAVGPSFPRLKLRCICDLLRPPANRHGSQDAAPLLGTGFKGPCSLMCPPSWEPVTSHAEAQLASWKSERHTASHHCPGHSSQQPAVSRPSTWALPPCWTTQG